MNTVLAFPNARPVPPAIPVAPVLIGIGTRVSTRLYNRGEGFVFAVHDDLRPAPLRPVLGGFAQTGGRQTYDIVFLSGAFTLRLPEAILRGPGWRLLDGCGSAAEIAASIVHAEAEDARRTAEKRAADETHAAELDRLRHAPEHARLRQGDDSQGGKLAAANLRVVLRQAFPGVRFSVRNTDHGSIYVRWPGGPDQKTVEAVAMPFQCGHFDGMDDSYKVRRSAWCEVFGGAQYVVCRREA